MNTNSLLRRILHGLLSGGDPSSADLEDAFGGIFDGQAEPVLLAALLTALRMRPVRAEHLVAGARALRAHALTLDVQGDVVDTCGTGGLGRASLNVSTGAALVAAAAGALVAKHGNRSAPPKTGSADVLEALGVGLDPGTAVQKTCLSDIGFAFFFAPAHHAAMRHAAPVRSVLKMHTLFNLLGPLSNPAQARRHVLGVASPDWLMPMAEALRDLGAGHCLVVHGLDGIDEISVSAPTRIAHLREGVISLDEIDPESMGIQRHDKDVLAGAGPQENAAALRDVLDGRPSPFSDAIALNAGAALFVAGCAGSLAEGCTLARTVIGNGAAKEKLDALIALTAHPA